VKFDAENNIERKYYVGNTRMSAFAYLALVRKVQVIAEKFNVDNHYLTLESSSQ
jgi:hypothetical protein